MAGCLDADNTGVLQLRDNSYHANSRVNECDWRRLSRRDFVVTGLSAVAGPILAGCGDSSTEPITGPSRLTARPGQPTVAPIIGLSQLGLGTGKAYIRDGLLYVPQSYSPERPAPLFVALHGAGGDAENWGSYYARAEDNAMILLAPEARLYTWDRSLQGFGPDVAFLDLALNHTFARCRVDPKRIALGGFSEGASYTLSLGVSNGDLFSHLIAYSPGYYRPAEPFVGDPPIFVSHGTGDWRHQITLSRDIIVPALREAGYDVTYIEFDGPHEVPTAISESALDWFLGGG